MATVGTVTVEVTPVLPKDATEQIETAVRTAIAEALRNLADGLVATPTGAVKEERFYVEQINGIWGVRDRETPDEWAAYGEEEEDEQEAQRVIADSLNADPLTKGDWDWTATGEY